MQASPPEEITPLIGNRQMLADQVFEAILSLLLDDKVPTGAPLSIDGLAKRFQVSSTPVREALAKLEMTGMVTREALRGYRVAPEPTAGDVQKILEARLLLEPAITSLACSNQGEHLVIELRDCNERLNRSRGGESFADYRAYWKADEQFHRKIAEAAGNKFLLHAYSAIEGHIQRFRLTVQNTMSGEHTIREHAAIIDALESKDSSAALHAMNLHLDGIKARAEDVLKGQHDTP